MSTSKKRTVHPDAARAMRREARRENMSPAEKERFDTGVRPYSDLAQARQGRKAAGRRP